MNAPMLATSEARTTHAPPPEKKRSGARTGVRVSSEACWCARSSARVKRSGSTCAQDPVRNRRRRERERAIRRDPHENGDGGHPLGRDAAGQLREQGHDGGPERERQEQEPLEEDERGVRVGEPAVKPCDPRRVCVRERRTVRGPHRDAGTGGECEASPCETRAHADVEALVDAGEGAVRHEVCHDVVAEQHAAGVGAEHVIGVVVLSLVVLAAGEIDRAPPTASWSCRTTRCGGDPRPARAWAPRRRPTADARARR